METKVISNFTGALTRKLNGDLDSGFAKFATSWGYDPFTKPQNLTWLETPTNITGPIANLPLVAKNNGTNVFLYDQGKKLYQIQPNSATTINVDSVVGIGSVAAGVSAISNPCSMEFFGDTVQVYIGTPSGVNKANTDGSSDSFIGSSARYVQNVYRPLKQFSGSLRFGNGKTIGTIDSTGSVSSPVASVAGANVYSDLNPYIPVTMNIADLDVSIDYNYLLMSASEAPVETINAVAQDVGDSNQAQGGIFKWNGSDAGITAATQTPSQALSALQVYLGNNLFFGTDALGSSLSDETKKLFFFPNNKSPLPEATCTNGNFLTWANPEIVGSTRYVTLYYFGQLDGENPQGLWRMMRLATPQSNAQVFQVPVNTLVNNTFMSLTSAGAIATIAYGKHYIGFNSVNNSSTYANYLFRFNVPQTGTGTPQLGVYETQTQLFSQKVVAKSVRVYCEPTAANNGFQIDLIGSDGNVLTNGTLTYTYVSGTDITKLQGALDRINFQFTAAPSYALGVRITNTGTANMTFKKIEIDWETEGK